MSSRSPEPPAGWQTAGMIDTDGLATAAAPGAVRARGGNPYAIGLVVVAGIAWVLAFMLWVVHAQVTDFTTYDLETAAALTAWIQLLVIGGFVALVGAVVIAGVRHELGRVSRRG
jgi:hypothetical protein